ncbi:hypothetical protein L7F22_066499 [Adiantum nelumboides]|nr:hypothetical protein [Adiantum nelumboides]
MGSGSRLALLVQNSFRRISSTSYPHQAQQNKLLSSADHGAEYNLFEADLATRVQQLQLHSGGTSGSAHLNWLLDAFSSTLATYASLPPLLLSCPSSSQDSDASGHAPNYSQYVIAAQRADETLSLLDACASLKHTADDADRQLGRLQQTLQSAEQALRAPHVSRAQVQTAAHRLRAAACRLDVAMGSSVQQHKEEAHAALLLAAKSVQSAPHGSDPANQALDGTLLITLLTLASALSSFTSPTKCGAIRSACKLLVRYCSKSSSSSRAAAAWVAPFRQLQRDLRQEEMGSVFVELQALHASVISLLAALDMSTPDPQDINVEVVRRGVESLRKRAQEAGACLTRLRSPLASLFQALLTLRLALLHS